MKTDDLIRGLAEDPHVAPPPRRMLSLVALACIPVVALLFLLTLGPRPDLAAVATGSWRFVLKMTAVVALAVLAFDGLSKLTNPAERVSRAVWRLLPVVVLLACGIAVELWLSPLDQIGRRMIGKNALACVVSVLAFSVAPLAACLVAMRNGAPSSAAGAGALIGIFSASLGAAFYALHCTDDSPLFVALWYPLAIGSVGAAGALIGSRALRW